MHNTATMPLDRHGHLFPDEFEHLAEPLDRAWRKAGEDLSRTQARPTVVMLPEHGR